MFVVVNWNVTFYLYIQALLLLVHVMILIEFLKVVEVRKFTEFALVFLHLQDFMGS